jgi:hypothetical protein
MVNYKAYKGIVIEKLRAAVGKIHKIYLLASQRTVRRPLMQANNALSADTG